MFNGRVEKQDSLQGGATNFRGTSNAFRGDSRSAFSEFRAPSSQNPATPEYSPKLRPVKGKRPLP
jgi:hypothetical protein